MKFKAMLYGGAKARIIKLLAASLKKSRALTTVKVRSPTEDELKRGGVLRDDEVTAIEAVVPDVPPAPGPVVPFDLDAVTQMFRPGVTQVCCSICGKPSKWRARVGDESRVVSGGPPCKECRAGMEAGMVWNKYDKRWFPPTEGGTLKVVCAWCKKHLRGPEGASEISHGMCPACAAEFESGKEWNGEKFVGQKGREK